VRTGDEQATADSSGISEGVDFIRYFLLGVLAIALAVGSFVIYNTITITLAQRVREFATLRTLGASRRQIMRSVLLEGFALGVLASVIGLFGGVALAKGLSAVFDAMDLSMPQAGLVLATRTIIVSLVLGVGSRCWPRSSPPAAPWPSRRSLPCGRVRRCRPGVSRDTAGCGR
jgi:putative ABC transport system permease protein